MTDDREPFRTARDAGLKQRHEQRLAHARGCHEVECSCYKLPREADGVLRHHPTCPNRPSHAQAVIPEEAIAAAAKAIYEHDLLPGDWPWSALGQDQERLSRGRVALEAAFPHLRGRIGYELGRKETLEAHNHAPNCCCHLEVDQGPCPGCPVPRDIGKGSA